MMLALYTVFPKGVSTRKNLGAAFAGLDTLFVKRSSTPLSCGPEVQGAWHHE